MPGKEQVSTVVTSEEEAGLQLLDEWLRIENEHSDPGLVLPGREEIVAWMEGHPLPVLAVAAAAVWGPMLGAFCFR